MSTHKPVEAIDFDKLQAAGGPVSYNKQIGYGTFFLTSTVLVFGDNYDQVKITFTNSAGLFPNAPIFLNPQNTTQTNTILNSGLMTLTVDSVSLFPPTPDTLGSVALTAHWTDLNGNGKNSFVGTIASWTNPPAKL
ncbi:hypothetical protein HDF24_01165 [Mucilaginibacter sp. X4EP1]|uniref:hypothetical protein n=1 Tax=Mucilaginibacter sp. X4EP1 TaxID=2723092 RepID=UPI002167FA11|nr:hypothetical protein [Mucilaginibacter sp. X4EP1]MCS3811625.1 hypothetical protein [Mucilaginibacter sp. X4EP1]